MKRNVWFVFGLLVVSSMIVAQCAAPATEAPPPATEAPAPAKTEAPAEATEEAAAPEAAEEEAAPAAEPVTVHWWHITSNPGPHQDAWQEMADTYMAEHPNVTIEITILENEAFKSKLPTVMQSGEPPDLFQSWGGGTMNEYAKAGLLKDITADVAGEWGDSIGAGALGVYSYDGVQYGVPWDMGVVGWWYNEDLFAQAGIEAPPATWSELLEDVQKLKDAGITPIALGESEKWPGHFYWVYLAVRIGGKPAFDAAYNRTGSFADEPFVQAGEKLLELIALEPFQEGYQGMGHNDQEALMGNGEAAMQLMGQWAPQVMRDTSTSGESIGDALGFFAFPAVEGGAGGPVDAMGGGNGFVVGKNAPPEAVDFLRYLTSLENQIKLTEIGAIIPVVSGAEAAIADPNMAMVAEAVSAADYYQLYYDQYLPPAVGEAVNDAVQGLFAGTMTPEEVAQAVEAAAAEELGQ